MLAANSPETSEESEIIHQVIVSKDLLQGEKDSKQKNPFLGIEFVPPLISRNAWLNRRHKIFS